MDPDLDELLDTIPVNKNGENGTGTKLYDKKVREIYKKNPLWVHEVRQ